MPSGRTHLRIELLVWGVCATAALVLWVRGAVPGSAAASFLVSYLFSSLFLSPDLDLRYSRAARRWGCARLLWRPYAWVFPHRSVSHHLLLGPVTRIAYLAALIALAGAGLHLATGAVVRLVLPSGWVLGGTALGLYLPNQLHTLTDRATTHIRRRL